VFTLQNKGSYNKKSEQPFTEEVVFTLQNKGSYNKMVSLASLEVCCVYPSK